MHIQMCQYVFMYIATKTSIHTYIYIYICIHVWGEKQSTKPERKMLMNSNM